MNKINTDIISTTGININKYDILPSKVFINGVEITDTESWNNAINKIDEKDKEIERLKEDNEYLNKANIELSAEKNRLNNIINTMLDFSFFKEECPLNFGYTEKCDEEKAQDVFYEDDYCEENCNDDYKKCWLKYFERLQKLKGSDKE